MTFLRSLAFGFSMLVLPLSNRAAEPRPLASPAVSPADRSLAESLSVEATMKQIIGVFSTYGHPSVGCTFELNLGKLPAEKIDLTRPVDPRGIDHGSAYIPFQGPLVVDSVNKPLRKELGWSIVHLSAVGNGGRLVVQINAEEFVKGSKVRVYFLEESFGRIGCMAEAEGVLK